MMNFNRRILVPFVALVVIGTFILVRGSHSSDTIAPTITPAITPANEPAASPDEAVAADTAAPAPAASEVTPQPAPPAGPGSNSCWVHFFDDKGFDTTDDSHIIYGPGRWPNLRNLNGSIKYNWGDEIESLKVGPGAVITVWTGEQFTGRSITFQAGTEKISLKDLPGFSDNISSLEIKRQ